MSIADLYAVYLQYPSVVTDTRKLRPGDLFFALKGPSFNGNAFAGKAVAAGAAFAVIDEEQYSIRGKTILVRNVLETLQALALHHRQQFSIPFIAITGSNGKTTTKELLHAVLSTTYKTYTTEGNLNNHIGVPLTILKIGRDAEIAVIEMGANHLGEIAAYCRITLPTHGLITNCGKAHLEGFGSEEGVRRGKGELFDYLRSGNGTAFIMNDYPYLREMSKGIAEVYTYGTAEAAITGQAVAGSDHLAVNFNKGVTGAIQTALVGDYNLPNVLAAAAVGHYFSISDGQIKAAIEGYVPANSRSQLVQIGPYKVILDAYNANPSSMKAAIANFGKEGTENKMLVLGAMAELGENSVQEHQMIVEEIKAYNWQQVLLVGGDFNRIQHPYLIFATAEEAGQWLAENAEAHTRLLVKGSRSMQMEKVLVPLSGPPAPQGGIQV